jgi:hypothetical protein
MISKAAAAATRAPDMSVDISYLSGRPMLRKGRHPCGLSARMASLDVALTQNLLSHESPAAGAGDVFTSERSSPG